MKGQNYLVELLNALAVSQELIVSNIYKIQIYSRPISTSAWCVDLPEVLRTGRVNKRRKKICLRDFLVCLQDHLLNYSGKMFVRLLDVSFAAAVYIVVFLPFNRVL